MMTACSLCVLSFLTGHQGKQHHHAGGLGESMREDEAAEAGEENPYSFTLLSLFGSSVKRRSICISLNFEMSDFHSVFIWTF